MTTVIVLNPVGTDVTPFVTGAAMVPQLLKGTMRKPGDTVYTVPYVNQPGRQNVADGVEMLNTKLLNTAGDILVFGYSEGCQIADWWLWKYGQSTPVDPARLRFVLIANANRKYGGFVCGHPVFDAVGYTNGKPANTPYKVIDFTRQYDGVSDFPTAQPVQDALVGLQTVGSDQNALSGAMNAVAAVLADNVYKTAALNAISGLVLIHNIYLYVTLADPGNRELPEENITWIWSPTYPVPMLGLSTSFPSADRENRILIERAYQRPVEIPMPNYGSGPAWGQPTAPVPAGAVTGWWVPIRASRGKGSGAYSFAVAIASGLRRPRAAAAGSYGFASAPIGRRRPLAVASSSGYSFVGGPAIGDDNVRQATASGGYTFTGTAVGMSSQGKGSAAGAFNFAAGSAVGRRTPKATGPGAYSFGGAAAGRRTPRAAGAGAYVFAGSATGRKGPRAASSGAYQFAGTAAGKAVRRGSAAGAYVFAGSATGVTPPTFIAFSEVITVNRFGAAPPNNAATLKIWARGASGAGGRGFATGANNRAGGGGGGGGDHLVASIAVSDLGGSYDAVRGLGVTNAAGGTTYVSGAGAGVRYAGALGGARGGDGTATTIGAAGAGGTSSLNASTLWTVISDTPGLAGAVGGTPTGGNGGTAANATGYASPGGGGGAGLSNGAVYGQGGKGGNSQNATGATAPASAGSSDGATGGSATGQANTSAATSNAGGGGSGGPVKSGYAAGAGGSGGQYGGGGGGSSGTNGAAQNGGTGGDGYLRLEWT